MTIKEIIENYLVCHNFTGLVSKDRECGCEVSDLFACPDPGLNCEPGYKANCTEECDHDFGFEPGNWHIQLEKPKEE